MKNKRNSFFIITAIVLAVGLVSCSGSTEAPSVSVTPVPTASPTAETEPDETGQTQEPAVTTEPSETPEPVLTEEPSGQEDPPESAPTEEKGDEEMTGEKIFTLDELKEFDGQDGRPAYVAVDGIVYDLTDSKAWKNGRHNGFTAGRDLTDEIKNVSPHGVKNLEGIPVVGRLADGEEN